MADNFDIRELFLPTNLNKSPFEGLENTNELICTAEEMFIGCPDKYNLQICNIKGTIESFHAEILADIRSEAEIANLMKIYTENTNEVLRIATTK